MKCLYRKIGAFLLLFLFLLPQPVLAQESPWSDCMVTLKNEADDPIATVPTIKCSEVIFQIILNLAMEIAVVVLFIFLIIGGFRFMFAGGDPKATESAKNTLTYAILGLVLLIGIWLILRFIEYFTGIQVTIFKIGV